MWGRRPQCWIGGCRSSWSPRESTASPRPCTRCAGGSARGCRSSCTPVTSGGTGASAGRAPRRPCARGAGTGASSHWGSSTSRACCGWRSRPTPVTTTSWPGSCSCTCQTPRGACSPPGRSRPRCGSAMPCVRPSLPRAGSTVRRGHLSSATSPSPWRTADCGSRSSVRTRRRSCSETVWPCRVRRSRPRRSPRSAGGPWRPGPPTATRAASSATTSPGRPSRRPRCGRPVGGGRVSSSRWERTATTGAAATDGRSRSRARRRCATSARRAPSSARRAPTSPVSRPTSRPASARQPDVPDLRRPD